MASDKFLVTTTYPNAETLAARESAAAFSANSEALIAAGSTVAERVNYSNDLEYVYSRDGVLTARVMGEAWLNGCSVPRALANAHLASMDVTGQVACLLDPTFASHIAVALDKLGERRVLIAIVPEFAALSEILACHDFSAAIASKRLILLGGEHWPDQFAGVFESMPGLPLPSQLVRLPQCSPSVNRLIIPRVQQLVNQITAVRASHAKLIARSHRPPVSAKTLLVYRSTYSLGHGSGALLERAFDGERVAKLDLDNPHTASPLAIANAVAEAERVVAADVFRADAGVSLPPGKSWTTWVTQRRIASPVASAPGDRVLIADESLRATAIAAGWRSDQIEFAGWPTIELAPPTSTRILLLADTHEVVVPAVVEDYSSHKLVWQSIHRQLAAKPLSFTGDVASLLAEHCSPLGIDPATLSTSLFIDGLITPAYEQGIARLLIATGVSVDLAGRGWAAMPEFAGRSVGEVVSFEALVDRVAGYQTVVLPQSQKNAHEVDAVPRHVVRTIGREKSQLLSDVTKSVPKISATSWRAVLEAPYEAARLVA